MQVSMLRTKYVEIYPLFSSQMSSESHRRAPIERDIYYLMRIITSLEIISVECKLKM